MSAQVPFATAELEGLLDAQRARLLSGDFSSLLDDLAATEKAEVALASGNHDGEALVRLHRTAERNAALLQASARGVRAARRRLRELADAPVAETYTAEGRKVPLNSRRKARTSGQ